MLVTDSNALTASLVVDALRIRSQELDFYKQSLNAVITSSSILFAAAINAFGTFFVDPQAHAVPRSIYYAAASISIILELAALVTAIFTVIMGPGLALRGPSGSMDKAVDGMRDITWQMVKFFVGGMLFFQLSVCAYCWVCPSVDWYIALVMNVSLVVGTLVVARYGQIIYAKFDFDIEEQIANELTGAAMAFGDHVNQVSYQQQEVKTQQVHQQQQQTYNSFAVNPNSMLVDPAPTAPQNSMVIDQANSAIASAAKPRKKKGLF